MVAGNSCRLVLGSLVPLPWHPQDEIPGWEGLAWSSSQAHRLCVDGGGTDVVYIGYCTDSCLLNCLCDTLFII